MRTYRSGAVPANTADLSNFLRTELSSIEEAASRAEPFILLQELHVAPAKLLAGMTVLADGTDWNPGAGAGVYTYYGAAWHKLG
jgi:hypothetical protein